MMNSLLNKDMHVMRETNIVYSYAIENTSDCRTQRDVLNLLLVMSYHVTYYSPSASPNPVPPNPKSAFFLFLSSHKNIVNSWAEPRPLYTIVEDVSKESATLL